MTVRDVIVKFNTAASKIQDLSELDESLLAATLRQHNQRFRKGIDPDGSPWEALKRSTLSKRRKGKKRRGAKPLRDTGRLQQSIRLASRSRSSGKSRLVVGTDLVYAAMQQRRVSRGGFGTILVTVPEHTRLVSVRGRKRRRRVTVSSHKRIMEIPWGDKPARPFMGWGNKDIQRLEKLSSAWARKALKKAVAGA